MIALVGLEKYKIKKFDNIDLNANPRLALENVVKNNKKFFMQF